MNYEVKWFIQSEYNPYKYTLCLDIPKYDTVKSKILGSYDEDIKNIVYEVTRPLPKKVWEPNKQMYTPQVVYRIAVDVFVAEGEDRYSILTRVVISRGEGTFKCKKKKTVSPFISWVRCLHCTPLEES